MTTTNQTTNTTTTKRAIRTRLKPQFSPSLVIRTRHLQLILYQYSIKPSTPNIVQKRLKRLVLGKLLSHKLQLDKRLQPTDPAPKGHLTSPAPTGERDREPRILGMLLAEVLTMMTEEAEKATRRMTTGVVTIVDSATTHNLESRLTRDWHAPSISSIPRSIVSILKSLKGRRRQRSPEFAQARASRTSRN